MKMSNELEKLFNDQITLELEASTVYRQLAIEVDAQDLPGMAAWLRHQADEEIVHANKFIDHLLDRDNHPRIGAISAPKAQQTMTPLDVFTAALEHEQKVSESIRNLYREGDAAGDLDSRPLLSWFIGEQLEEEATVSEIIGRIRMINDDGPGLLRLDQELGQRPTQATENTQG
ncbi:ferritin [Luteococcus japonicus]|uniref:Ferritin n=2 Tax=Luteococcus japonicus TaxID=33984 RepID=A0A1R4JT37_9ACTN|nr:MULTISPECIES: ferritin [Luteococcus]MDN5563076.1 ferritin [Luteococcus sp.]ROR55944.1 ferritin [Luteococcus japonicus]SJN35187.1 ferritin [Luteococcus japonicus LSP_Lj1]